MDFRGAEGPFACAWFRQGHGLLLAAAASGTGLRFFRFAQVRHCFVQLLFNQNRVVSEPSVHINDIDVLVFDGRQVFPQAAVLQLLQILGDILTGEHHQENMVGSMFGQQLHRDVFAPEVRVFGDLCLDRGRRCQLPSAIKYSVYWKVTGAISLWLIFTKTVGETPTCYLNRLLK